jgi:hypothetical protein
MRTLILSIVILGSALFIPKRLERAPASFNLRPLPDKIWGITVDDVYYFAPTLDAIKSLSKPVMTRVVFDPWIPASYYLPAVKQLAQISYIMGEVVNSDTINWYTRAQSVNRWKNYLNTMGNQVDLWEIGNEVNGEWIGKEIPIVQKITDAYDLVKSYGGRTNLTLYYNPGCWSKPDHEMFAWVRKYLPTKVRMGVDYVSLSYFEDVCHNYNPNWQTVLSQVAALFPNSKVMIGECGTRVAKNKQALLTKYYSMKVDVPAFVGGYFWWYFRQDMVPKTKPLWKTLNRLISSP